MRVEENFALTNPWGSKSEVQFDKLEDIMLFCFVFRIHNIYLQPVFGEEKKTLFFQIIFFVIQNSTNSALVQNAQKNLNSIFVQTLGSRHKNNDKMYEVGMEKKCLEPYVFQHIKWIVYDGA